MSCNWRPELERELVLDEPCVELRGVKKRVKRFGVMGGGLFGFRLPVIEADAGGDDENISDSGSGSPPWAQGEDMLT